MGVWQKCSKTQGSKEILKEMDEWRLRSLEKCFVFLEEMVRWRRKIKWKKKVNSVNGGRGGDEGRSKKEEKRDKMNGGPKFDLHIKVIAELLSQLSQTELTQSTPKKKKNFFLSPFLFHS